MYELGEVVVSREQINERVRSLADRINADYAGKELLMVGVLKGAMIFLADLCRGLDIPVIIDFIIVSSYGIETQTSGVVLLRKDIDVDIAGRHVLIVEDIIDTGVTMHYLKSLFSARGPKSFKVCAAFDKPSRRKVNLTPDYCGFKLEDDFVVGYGLDFANMYRNLPDVRILVGG